MAQLAHALNGGEVAEAFNIGIADSNLGIRINCFGKKET